MVTRTRLQVIIYNIIYQSATLDVTLCVSVVLLDSSLCRCFLKNVKAETH